jgi:hypothetical protein
MVVNKGKNIIPTLQLIKSDGTSFEITATISYKIIDATGSTIVVASRTAAYNSNTGSYTDTLSPSADWTDQAVGIYLISWSIADTEDDFPSIVTETLEIAYDDVDLKRVLGLMHENIFIDQAGYDINGNLISARVRIYSDSASVGTANNIIGTYTITSDGQGRGMFTNWRQVRV